MALVGDPHRRELTGPQELGQCNRVAAIGLHPLARREGATTAQDWPRAVMSRYRL
jgi:hypothetical protein